jgi:integrase/recombinase XerD
MARLTGGVSRVMVAGPLAPFADAYEAELRDRGYAPRTIVNQQRQVARLSGWLEAGGLTVAALSGERLEQFCDARSAGGSGASCSRQGLIALLDVLRGLGVIELESPAGVDSKDEQLLASFGDYLLGERGLTAGTALAYAGYARRFLGGLSGDGELSQVTAGEVTAAVLRESVAVSAASAQYFVAALRSFLRFCFVEGLVAADLSAAALAVTGRRRSSLPMGISRTDATALLAGCDRRRAIGRRDYAVIITLLLLGLRAGEAAGLTLDDVDWRAEQHSRAR